VQKQQAWLLFITALPITKLFAWGRGSAEDMCYEILQQWLLRLTEALLSTECSPNVHFCPSRACPPKLGLFCSYIRSLLWVHMPSGRGGQTHMNHGNLRTYLIHPNFPRALFNLVSGKNSSEPFGPSRRRGGGHHSLKKIEPLRFKFSNSGNHPSVNKMFSSPSPPPSPPPVHLHSAQPRSYLKPLH
jgi:hypothetical protein